MDHGRRPIEAFHRFRPARSREAGRERPTSLSSPVPKGPRGGGELSHCCRAEPSPPPLRLGGGGVLSRGPRRRGDAAFPGRGEESAVGVVLRLDGVEARSLQLRASWVIVAIDDDVPKGTVARFRPSRPALGCGSGRSTTATASSSALDVRSRWRCAGAATAATSTARPRASSWSGVRSSWRPRWRTSRRPMAAPRTPSDSVRTAPECGSGRRPRRR